MSREMKESGIPWIGRIPSHWNILRIKNTSWLKGRIGWDGLKSSEFIDDGPYLITGTDFSNGRVNWDTCVHITEERYAEDILLHIYEGDLLITKDGTIGKLAVVSDCPEKVSLNSGVMIIRGNNPRWKYNKKYMYYLLSSPEFTIWFSLMQKPNSTIQHLYQQQFSDFQYTFPPLPEQAAIVSFLDSRCAKIDEAISRHRRIIEKLEGYRKAVITKAVTKGLDPNVEVKDSGIPRIGNIPDTWKVVRIKFLVKMKSGTNITSEDIQSKGKYPVYGGNGLRGYYNKYNLEGEHVLIGRQGALAGNVHLVNGTIWATDHALIVHNTGLITNKLLAYLLDSMNLNQYAFETAAQPGLAASKIGNLQICFTGNIEEQKEIVDYLDKITSTIDETTVHQRKAITKLEEYRKSLIYNAVTGKIDCRNK